MRNFKIEGKYYETDWSLYKKKNIEIESGLTVLVGCNGSGKSTLLHQIKDELKKNEITYMKFDNLHDGGSNARSKAGFLGEIEFLATSVCSSEGEEIILNIGKMANKIGNFIHNSKNTKELWLLLDAVDSGLSVDNIIDVKNLFGLIIEDCSRHGIEGYIVISANEYELARNKKCFDVYNGKYITFKDYEDYRNFIIKSREAKNKRYKDTE